MAKLLLAEGIRNKLLRSCSVCFSKFRESTQCHILLVILRSDYDFALLRYRYKCLMSTTMLLLFRGIAAMLLYMRMLILGMWYRELLQSMLMRAQTKNFHMKSSKGIKKVNHASVEFDFLRKRLA